MQEELEDMGHRVNQAQPATIHIAHQRQLQGNTSSTAWAS
jgi:hypothetical protein